MKSICYVFMILFLGCHTRLSAQEPSNLPVEVTATRMLSMIAPSPGSNSQVRKFRMQTRELWVVITIKSGMGMTLDEVKKLDFRDVDGFAQSPKMLGFVSNSSDINHPESIKDLAFYRLQGAPTDQVINAVVFEFPRNSKGGVIKMTPDSKPISLSWKESKSQRQLEAENRMQNERVRATPRPRPTARPTPVPTPSPTPADVVWVEAPQTLGTPYGVSRSGFKVFSVAEGQDYLIFDPKEGKFRIVGPAPTTGACVGIAGDLLLVADPVTRDCSVFNLSTGDRLYRYFLDIPSKSLVGFVGHHLEGQKVLMAVGENDDNNQADLSFLSLQIETGKVTEKMYTGNSNYWRNIQTIGFKASRGFEKIFMRNISTEHTILFGYEKMMGGYNQNNNLISGATLMDDGSMASVYGTRDRSRTPGRIVEYALPARGASLQIVRTQKNDLCLWDPDAMVQVANFGRLKEIPDSDRHHGRSNSIGDMFFDVKTGLFYYAPQKNKNGLFFGKLNVAAAMRIAGESLYLTDQAPPPIVPGEPWTYTPTFLGKAPGEVSLAPDTDPKVNITGSSLNYQKDNIISGVVEVQFSAECGAVKKKFTLTLPVAERKSDGSLVIKKQVPGWEVPHTVVDTDGEVEQFIVAGNGNLALCKVPEKKQWTITNLVTRRVQGHIPFGTSSGSVFAAGNTRAVLYDESTNQFSVYSLPDGKKLTTYRNSSANTVHGMAMGTARDDSIFIIDRKLEEGSQQWDWRISNVMDGEALQPGGRLNGDNLLESSVTQWRATPDMEMIIGKISTRRELARITKTTGIWICSLMPAQDSDGVSALSGGQIASGSYVYSAAKKELYNYVDERNRNNLTTENVFGAPMVAATEEHSLSKFLFYRDDAKDLLFSLADVPELRENTTITQGEHQLRFHFDFQRQIGALAPFGSKGLIVFQWQVPNLFSKAPEILLPQEATVTPGKIWQHNIQVLHAGSEVKIKLGDAPEGMRITDQEQYVQWLVPESLREPVIVEFIATDETQRRSLRTIVLRPEVAELTELARAGETVSTALLGFETVSTGISASSPLTAIGFEGHLALLDSRTGKVTVHKDFTYGIPRHMALRADSLFIQEKNLISIYDLHAMKKQVTFQVGMNYITALQAPPGTPNIFFAGVREGAEAGEKHVVGMMNPETKESTFLSGVHGTCLGISQDSGGIFCALNHTHKEQSVRYDPYMGVRYPVTITTHLHEAGSYILNGASSKLINETRISSAPVKVSVNHDFTLAGITHAKRDNDGLVEITGISFYNPASMEPVSLNIQSADALTGFTAHPFLPAAVVWGKDFAQIVDIPSGNTQIPNLKVSTEFASVTEMHWIDLGKKILVVGTHTGGRKMIQVLSIPFPIQQLARLPKTYGQDAIPAAANPLLAQKKPKINTIRDSKASEIILKASPHMVGPSSRALKPAEIAEQYSRSVVIIASEEGSGTGMVISRNGLILTCDHVLPSSNRFTVETPGKNGGVNRYKGIIVLRDPENDVALVRVEEKPIWYPVAIEAARKAKMGEGVSTIGHPGMGSERLAYTMTQGVISNPKRMINGQQYIQTSAPVNPGVSGGPLFDERGNVIGMVTAKAMFAEGIAFAIPSSKIIQLMKTVVNGDKKK